MVSVLTWRWCLLPTTLFLSVCRFRSGGLMETESVTYSLLVNLSSLLQVWTRKMWTRSMAARALKVELVVHSTRISQGGTIHIVDVGITYIHLTFFSAVKSLVTTKSIYFDSFLTDGINMCWGRKPISNWYLSAIWAGGSPGGSHIWWHALGESEKVTLQREWRIEGAMHHKQREKTLCVKVGEAASVPHSSLLLPSLTASSEGCSENWEQNPLF